MTVLLGLRGTSRSFPLWLLYLSKFDPLLGSDLYKGRKLALFNGLDLAVSTIVWKRFHISCSRRSFQVLIW